MKKILIFPGYFTPHVGGLESHVDELVRRLSKEGFKITVFAPNIPKTKDYEKISPDLEVIRYPAFDVITNFPMPKFWSKEYRKHIKNFRKQRFDIVMSRTRFFFSSFLACRFAKKNKIKFIHVEHGSEHVKVNNPFVNISAWLYDQTLGSYVIKKSDLCIAISKASKEFIMRFRKRGKVPVITRGVEFGFIDSIKEDDSLKKMYPDKILIGFVGRVIYWKGLENALKGFEMLNDELRNKCVFLVVGDGPDLKRLKRIYTGRNIVFLGSKPRKEAIALLKSFDIYVHSTMSGGGLSNSLLEAMTAQIPIVATGGEGAKEVLDEKSAVIIDKSSPELFKKSFEKMIKDEKLRQRIKMNAKNYVRKNFNWEDKIKDYAKVLESSKI